MSSEDSDDNFLSADEGSEAEDGSHDKVKMHLIENLVHCNKTTTRPRPTHSSFDLNIERSDEILKSKDDFVKIHTEAIVSNFTNPDTASDENNSHLGLGLDKISEHVLKTDNTYETCDSSSTVDFDACFENRPTGEIGISLPTPRSIIKPIKESKIGLKKPREKLGARLGNKKLGARVTKPLVGISCDSVQISHGANKNSSVDKASLSNENPKIEACKSSDVVEELQKPQHQEMPSYSNWGAWGDWSSTLVSAASSLTKEVSRGVETVMESVESSLGVPDPEVLAKESFEVDKKLKEMGIDNEERTTLVKGEAITNSENDSAYGYGFSGFGKLMSGVSGAFETASNTVLLGGLETLEKIGRKTMDVIQEGDPGLRRKRAFLHSNKPNLSVVLKEARERALDEEENKITHFSREGGQPVGIVSIELIWDGTEGSAHLEALGLIAKQCNLKTSHIMQEMPALGLNRLQPFISKIKTCCEIDEGKVTENLSNDLNKVTRDVQLPLQFSKLLTGWPSFENFIKKLSIEIQAFNSDEKLLIDMQKDLLTEVVLIVSCLVGVTHKAAELCLISPEIDYILLAKQFNELCSGISVGLERSADHVCESVTKTLPSSDSFVSSAITNIYIQMAEANSYVQSSLQHFTTVLIQVQAKQIASEL